jgi:hypothetical protein
MTLDKQGGAAAVSDWKVEIFDDLTFSKSTCDTSLRPRPAAPRSVKVQYISCDVLATAQGKRRQEQEEWIERGF